MAFGSRERLGPVEPVPDDGAALAAHSLVGFRQLDAREAFAHRSEARCQPFAAKPPKQTAGPVLGYGRVSRDRQDLAQQRAALCAAGCTRLFEEKAAGGRWDRPELHRLLDHLRPGDGFMARSARRSGLSWLASTGFAFDKGLRRHNSLPSNVGIH